jgi:cadherin 5 type 2 (VE-cadherin)
MYGPVFAYTVIVAEDDSVNTNLLDLPSWNDVQEYSIWPPYQASEPFYPFNSTITEDFTIGAEE